MHKKYNYKETLKLKKEICDDIQGNKRADKKEDKIAQFPRYW